MNDADRLRDFLIRAFGKAYCDDCLAAELGLPVAEVREQIGILAEEVWTKQSDAACALCSLTKPVIRRRVSAFAS